MIKSWPRIRCSYLAYSLNDIIVPSNLHCKNKRNLDQSCSCKCIILYLTEQSWIHDSNLSLLVPSFHITGGSEESFISFIDYLENSTTISGFYLLSIRSKDCLHLLKYIFNGLCGMNLKVSSTTTFCYSLQLLDHDAIKQGKTFYLPNFPLSFVVLNYW